MNHLPTAPFILKKFDIVNCSLAQTPLVLIVSDTDSMLFAHSRLAIVVPVFPVNTVPFDTDPTFKPSGVFIPGGPNTRYQLEQDMWIAANLLRTVTKDKIIGRERVTRLDANLGNKVMGLIRGQLGI